MALYTAQDIEADDGGRIVLENGDLKLASVKRSHLQVLHWLMATGRGGTPDGDTVADLGAWVGSQNASRIHRSMEAQIRRAVWAQRVFIDGDVLVKIIPVDLNSVAVTAKLQGLFIEPDPAKVEEDFATLGYHYLLGTGQLVKVTSPDPYMP